MWGPRSIIQGKAKNFNDLLWNYTSLHLRSKVQGQFPRSIIISNHHQPSPVPQVFLFGHLFSSAVIPFPSHYKYIDKYYCIRSDTDISSVLTISVLHVNFAALTVIPKREWNTCTLYRPSKSSLLLDASACSLHSARTCSCCCANTCKFSIFIWSLSAVPSI